MQYTHWQRHTQKMTWEDNEGLFLCLKLCLVPDWGQYQDITLQMLICVMVKLSSAKFRPHPGFWLRDEKLHATYSEKRRGKKMGFHRRSFKAKTSSSNTSITTVSTQLSSKTSPCLHQLTHEHIHAVDQKHERNLDCKIDLNGVNFYGATNQLW